MPFKDPDPTDPNMLIGVMLAADADATRDMAYVFAEEFARLGYSREQLLWLFKNPFYGGAHGAYRALGENEILTIVDECLNAWGQAKFSILDFGSFDPAQDRFSIEEGSDQNTASKINSDEALRQIEDQINAAAHSTEIRTIENPKSKIQNRGSGR
jgi:hypothetical protein